MRIHYFVMSFIEIKDLHFTYTSDDGTPLSKVLHGVNLNVEQGEFLAIVGKNGSGKSTLAKHFNALLLPTEGSICIDGMDTKDENKLWDIRSKCGMVFQNPDNQLVSSIVEDDVAFGPENLGVDPAEIRRRVDQALKAVGMYEHRKKGPHLLSGGQKQRVAIAGVLAMQSDCIVFDEPTAMLDPKGRKEIMEIIKDIQSKGKTIILITHFMEEAAMADRVAIMNKGVIAACDSPREIFSKEGLLREYKIDLPFAAELSEKLRMRGIDVPADIYTEDELAAYLSTL